MPLPSKARVLAAVVTQLEAEATGLEASARAAHEAATHEESRAEDAHDTRGLEASYLAGAQAGRVAELRQLIAAFRQATLPEGLETVEVGALVALKLGSRRSLYLLVERGGGRSVDVDGVRVNLLSPSAPLGEALLGRRLGDEVEVETQGVLREYEIAEIG